MSGRAYCCVGATIEPRHTLLGRGRSRPTSAADNRALRAQAERMAKNTPIQGTAADIMKVAMVNVQRALDASGMEARMILTVHDELVFEAPEAELDALTALVREKMERAIALEVPLVVECGRGRTWGDAH